MQREDWKTALAVSGVLMLAGCYAAGTIPPFQSTAPLTFVLVEANGITVTWSVYEAE